MMPNNKTFLNKVLRAIYIALFWIFIWEILSLTLGEDLRIFLPSPFAVIKRLCEIILTAEYLKACAVTLLRILLGFVSGAILGITIGIITSSSNIAYALLSPALRVIRAVPVVSFIILAFLFINVDSLPIFISFLMVVPLVWQATHTAIINTDKNLSELGRVFGMGRLKILFKIKLNEAFPEIVSALVSGLGFAWKSGVAAEVICTPDISLGHEIFKGKFNLDYEAVYAVTLTVVLLSIVIEILLKGLTDKYLLGGKHKNA